MSRNPRSLKGALQRKTKAELIDLLLTAGEYDFQTRIYMKERLFIRRDQEADLEGFYDELRSYWPFPGNPLSESSEKKVAIWFADATALLGRRPPATTVDLAWFALEALARLQLTCADLEQADRLADLAVRFHVAALRLIPCDLNSVVHHLAEIEVQFEGYIYPRINEYAPVLGQKGIRFFEKWVDIPLDDHEMN